MKEPIGSFALQLDTLLCIKYESVPEKDVEQKHLITFCWTLKTRGIGEVLKTVFLAICVWERLDNVITAVLMEAAYIWPKRDHAKMTTRRQQLAVSETPLVPGTEEKEF